MTKMMYIPGQLSEPELKKVVGGDFTDTVRKIGCFMGVCDSNNRVLIGEKASADRTIIYRKYRCRTCGRIRCYRETITSYGPHGPNGYVHAISENAYNSADAPIDMLTI